MRILTRREWAGLATAPLFARELRLSRFDIQSVRIPFAERVREAWLESWKHQKRDQTDYELHFVRLHTDDGLTGIGEAKMPRAQAESVLRRMMGRPAAEFAGDDSIRGILIAIYDILGKAAGKPVSKVLSPSATDRVIPTWWSQCFPPAVMASEAKLGASLGYRIHKVKARPWQDPIEQAAAMCAAVPRHYRFWADANSSWGTVEKTVDVATRLAKFPNYFAIESPISRANADGYRQLRGKLPLKVAEHVDGIDLDLWIREKLIDAWISGAPKLGRYISTLSERALAAKAPIWIEHSIDNGIAQVFQAHQAAAYPGIQYVISVTNVLADDCMAEPFTVRDGFYHIPDRPGLGVSLDEAALEKYRIA
ncbi:MAG: mandelate racemase/muconate lactonizing enzyme family protein [Bryobacterales bacterium]|nr:mandelate racemase/muconate lactonizing enzyme family protein [Bryobacterales bacterium]